MSWDLIDISGWYFCPGIKIANALITGIHSTNNRSAPVIALTTHEDTTSQHDTHSVGGSITDTTIAANIINKIIETIEPVAMV